MYHVQRLSLSFLSIDLWLGLQLQRTARFGQQRKSADPMQDRCSPGYQYRPGKSLERDESLKALFLNIISVNVPFSGTFPSTYRLRVDMHIRWHSQMRGLFMPGEPTPMDSWEQAIRVTKRSPLK